MTVTHPTLPSLFRLSGLVAGLACWLAFGCAGPSSAPADLHDVESPGDLPALDAAVRTQFEQLQGQLESLRESDAPDGARADAWGALGRWFDVYGYPNSATLCYLNARQLDANEARWPYHLGVLAAARSDFEAAEEFLGIAASLAPDEAGPRLRLAALALDRQDLEAAESRYRSVLADEPETAGALLGLGRIALLRGDGTAALEPLRQAHQLQPNASEVLYSLGLAWQLAGDEGEARRFLDAVPADNLEQVGLAPDSPWDRELQSFDFGARTLTRQGIRAARQGRDEQAVLLLGRAVQADPDGPEKRINYALALARIGRVPAALDELARAHELADPGSASQVKALLETGRLLGTQARLEEGISRLEEALAMQPDSMVVQIELGRLYFATKRFAEALAQYAAARGAEQALPEVCFWHAVTLLHLGETASANAALEEDLQLFGDDPQLAALRARILSSSPDPTQRDVATAQGIVRQLQDASDEPPSVFLAETYAMVAAASGRFDEAITWQLAAVNALGTVRRRRADHAAQRRLALYREGEPCRSPWEPMERMVRIEAKPVDAEPAFGDDGERPPGDSL